MFWLKFCIFEGGYIWNVVYEADFDVSLIITQYYLIYLQNVVWFIFVDMLKFHGQPCQTEKIYENLFHSS